MIVPDFLSNREPSHPTKIVLAGMFFGLSFAAHESSAADFKFQSSLTSVASSVWRTSEENESDEISEQESVLSFNPKALLTISGKQVDINAELGVQHRVFTETGAYSTIPEITISALSRVYGNTYTVGALARSLGRIENVNSSVDGSIEDSDEIPVIYNFEFQQHVKTRLGSNAVLQARQSSAVSQSTLNSDIGSNSHTLEFTSDAILTRAGLIGRVRGGYQLTDYENDIQGFNSTLGSELQIPLGAAVKMKIAAGYEWIRSEETDLELAGEIAYLGFLWNPIARLNAELGYGSRVFGESPRARISYTARRSGLSLSWTRDLQSYRLNDFAEDLDAVTIDVEAIGAEAIGAEAFGAEAVSDEGVLNFNGLGSSSPFLNQQRNINEIVTLEMFFNTLRTSYIAVFAFVENEDIEDASIDEVSEIATLQAIRKFGQTLEIGLEGVFSGEVDESDIRSTRRKISVFSTWRF